MTTTISFYETEAEAISESVFLNHADESEIWVVVEGPDNDWAVMTLKEAIDSEFLYSWYR